MFFVINMGVEVFRMIFVRREKLWIKVGWEFLGY